MDVLLNGWPGFVAAGVFGLCVGSYSNVVIFRSPLEGLSSFRPKRSFCPQCRAQLSWFDNLPVLSWFVLWGRCRSCESRISLRYPIVELLVGALVVGAWWLHPPSDGQSLVWLMVTIYLAVTCVIVSMIDLDHLIIPDTITLPGLGLGLLVALAFPFLHVGHWMYRPEEPVMSSLFASLAGVVAGGGSLWLVGKLGSLFLKRAMEEAGVEDAMGFGDVKWMAHTGAFVGGASALGAIVVACFAGASIGILLKIVGWLRGGRQPQPIPFGPFLSLGLLVELARPGLAWETLQMLAQPAA